METGLAAEHLPKEDEHGDSHSDAVDGVGLVNVFADVACDKERPEIGDPDQREVQESTESVDSRL